MGNRRTASLYWGSDGDSGALGEASGWSFHPLRPRLSRTPCLATRPILNLSGDPTSRYIWDFTETKSRFATANGSTPPPHTGDRKTDGPLRFVRNLRVTIGPPHRGNGPSRMGDIGGLARLGNLRTDEELTSQAERIIAGLDNKFGWGSARNVDGGLVRSGSSRNASQSVGSVSRGSGLQFQGIDERRREQRFLNGVVVDHLRLSRTSFSSPNRHVCRRHLMTKKTLVPGRVRDLPHSLYTARPPHLS